MARYTDREIIESLLDEAPGAKNERLRQESQTDPHLATRCAEWRAILAAMPQGAKEHRLSQARAIDRVMRRLPDLSRETQDPVTHGWPSFFPTHMATAGWIVATGVVLLVGLWCLPFSGTMSNVTLPGQKLIASKAGLAPVGELNSNPTRFVEFDFSGKELGSPRQPFQSIKQGVAALPPGGMLKIKGGATPESLRISKPVVLVAMGGQVRIGVPERRAQ
jgi:hypothetical protein